MSPAVNVGLLWCCDAVVCSAVPACDSALVVMSMPWPYLEHPHGIVFFAGTHGCIPAGRAGRERPMHDGDAQRLGASLCSTFVWQQFSCSTLMK
mmetsp:Transcript_93247/g.249712  ORF Transcript_93247/g.249712 Transcript_93247/m.249712 type:complete len:94 (-) Transcript_93247:134-415(-)